MSAKELGMIHSVHAQRTGLTSADSNTLVHVVDLPYNLTESNQQLIRQGQYFKLVGIDIALSASPSGTDVGGRISGYFRYYRPTYGRCKAYREAFKAMAKQMANQGIPMRENAQYDFRVGLTNNPQLPVPMPNNATLDGVTGLALNHGTPGASVFGVYNQSIQPVTAAPATDLFGEGFDTLLQSGAAKTDFVLNDAQIWSGNEDVANLEFEQIPFQVSFGDDNTTTIFQWRPDPALYAAVMCGLFELYIEDCSVDDPAGSLELDMNFMIAGWKSIMKEPRDHKEKK